MSISFSELHALVAMIQAGKNGRAFIAPLDHTGVPFLPQRYEEDNWGPKRGSCISPTKSTTDEMWEAIRRLLSLPCARAHLNVKEFDFSNDHPAAGGVWEKWYVMDSALLSHFIDEYQKKYDSLEQDMPEEMRRVLSAAHEYNDGQGGKWETIVIKHTVV
jgi:hypothetical protein